MKTSTQIAAAIAAELIRRDNVTEEGIRAAIAPHRWVDAHEVRYSLGVQLRGDDPRRRALGL